MMKDVEESSDSWFLVLWSISQNSWPLGHESELALLNMKQECKLLNCYV